MPLTRPQSQRSETTGWTPPTGELPGVIAVNVTDRKLWAYTGAGAPVLISSNITDWDTAIQYRVGDWVIQGNSLYRANTSPTVGTFLSGQWDTFTTSLVSDFDSVATYAPGEAVHQAGAIYSAANIVAPGVFDPEDWNKLTRDVVTVSATAPTSQVNNELWYDTSTSTLSIWVAGAWVPVSASAASPGVVASVFGRSGAVVAASGDYTAAQIGYDGVNSSLSASTVQAAIDQIAGSEGGTVTSVFGRGGAVVPAVGDYSSEQITFNNSVSGIPAASVEAALNFLASLLPTLFRPASLAARLAANVVYTESVNTVLFETIDINQFPGTPYDPSTGEFTTPATGTYLVCYGLRFFPLSFRIARVFFGRINYGFSRAETSAVAHEYVSFSQVVQLTAGDIVRIQIEFADSDLPVTLLRDATRFSITRLS